MLPLLPPPLLGQVAELSGISVHTRQLEQDLTSARTELAASEEGLRQATLRLEKADARAEVGADGRAADTLCWVVVHGTR